jgi:Spy/CpxP family protein refolding chaperone
MGFALPAELNGYPGPRHVLDLADDLELTDEQLTEIQALFDEMLPQAIALGEQILTQEEALELAFRDETITDEFLRSSLAESGRLEGELRYVHLSTHLATIDILTPHQVLQYNQLRGYDAPEHDGAGHDGHDG